MLNREELGFRARESHPGLMAIGADVRNLPFSAGQFNVIISISTLDHFKTRQEIKAGLHEFERVLCVGGHLIITLDNLLNPAVAIRNVLPFTLLNRLRIVPYRVGTTLNPGRFHQYLKEAGFKVLNSAALMHSPRILTVALSGFMGQWLKPRSREKYLKALLAFEALSRLPLRYLTGYYIALHAVKH
jgi:ubiquinone/menaquinone biosynthesis C-methylase UbiE